jgi:hypothetical protein
MTKVATGLEGSVGFSIVKGDIGKHSKQLHTTSRGKCTDDEEEEKQHTSIIRSILNNSPACPPMSRSLGSLCLRSEAAQTEIKDGIGRSKLHCESLVACGYAHLEGFPAWNQGEADATRFPRITKRANISCKTSND